MLRKSYKLMQKTRSMFEQTRHDMARMTFASNLYARSLDRQMPKAFVCCPPDPWTGDATRGNDLTQYVMAHTPDQLQALTAPQWFDRVDANFHRHDWLMDLRALGSDDARVTAVRLINSWIEHNPSWQEKTWDGALMGSRLLRWVGAYAFMLPALDAEANERLVTATARQGRHLKRVAGSSSLPLENLQAAAGLIAAGVALGHDPYWIEAGLKQIQTTVQTFILPDGGPVSRRGEDLCTALRVLHEVHALLMATNLPVPSFVTHTIDRIVPAIRFLRQSNHTFAIFHGAREYDAQQIEDVLLKCHASGRAPASLPYTGFEKLVAGNTSILIDTASRMVDDAHLHASTTAFEMTHGDDRIITSCGQHAHDPRWHDLLSASAAHSMLTLDGFDNRIAGLPVHCDCERQEFESGLLIQVQHDGYVTRNGFMHQRRIFMNTTGDDVRGEDDVGVAISPLTPVTYTLRFHLHPGCSAALTQNGQAVLIRTASGTGWKFQHDGEALTLEDSLYLGATGLPQKTRQIVVSGKIRASAHKIKWALRSET